jgi:PPM family protein phosphatase
LKTLTVQVAQRTCIGSRSRNEDCIAVEEHGGHWCLVLCDGAGGHGEGARAARLATDAVLTGFRSRPPVDPSDLSELLLDAHDAVLAGQREAGLGVAAAAMHATVVVLLIDTSSGVALWGHVGDSRLYRWREGRLHAVTHDDSVLQWVLDTGLVEASRAQEVPNRGVLLSALGSAEEVAPHVSEPLDLEDSDAFLLCSDGWWGGLDPELISNLLADASSTEDWLEAMAATTREHADPRQDNYSAIACWIGAPAEAREGQSVTEAETLPPRVYPHHAPPR